MNIAMSVALFIMSFVLGGLSVCVFGAALHEFKTDTESWPISLATALTFFCLALLVAAYFYHVFTYAPL